MSKEFINPVPQGSCPTKKHDFSKLSNEQKDRILLSTVHFLESIDIEMLQHFVFHYAWEKAENEVVPSQMPFMVQAYVLDLNREVNQYYPTK